MDKLIIFVQRLAKINIKVNLSCNYPWVYLEKINNKKVSERFCGKHGFTIAFLPVMIGKELQFTDLSEIFKLIRKYTK